MKTYWGSGEEGVRGRQTESKALIVIAAQEDRDGVGARRASPQRCLNLQILAVIADQRLAVIGS
jgi:hypothetical protein